MGGRCDDGAGDLRENGRDKDEEIVRKSRSQLERGIETVMNILEYKK